jgi:uncharacterized protein
MGERTVGAEWPADTLDVAELTAAGWRPVPFQQFVLKVHGRCNLACDYCYLYEMADQTWRTRPAFMTPQTAEIACRRIAEHAVDHCLDRVQIVLHGGEPLLAGADLLAEIASKLRAMLPASIRSEFVVQTNGVLLDDHVLRTLAAQGIRIGVSLDGDDRGHDRHRRYANGRGSYDAVVGGLRLLSADRYRGMFAGLLCVVDLDSDPVSTYDALIEFEPPRVDFLLPHGNWSVPPPGLDPAGTGTPYGDWLVAAFDRWYDAGKLETEVRLFTEIVTALLGGASRSEEIGISPVALIVVDTDGSLEQVDTLRSAYHGAAATKLNVRTHPLDAALEHPAIVARQIGLAALGETCQQCDLRRVCGGGYYPHRYLEGSGFRHESVYCRDLTRLIRHIRGRLQQDVADLLGRRR